MKVCREGRVRRSIREEEGEQRKLLESSGVSSNFPPDCYTKEMSDSLMLYSLHCSTSIQAFSEEDAEEQVSEVLQGSLTHPAISGIRTLSQGVDEDQEEEGDLCTWSMTVYVIVSAESLSKAESIQESIAATPVSSEIHLQPEELYGPYPQAPTVIDQHTLASGQSADMCLEYLPGGHGADDYETDEGDALILTLKCGEEVVGSASYSLDGGTLHLRWVETEEAYQQQGVATAILRALEDRYPQFAWTTNGFTPEGEALCQSLELPLVDLC
jgi:GNAT superfamily N-acetyltransferase